MAAELEPVKRAALSRSPAGPLAGLPSDAYFKNARNASVDPCGY